MSESRTVKTGTATGDINTSTMPFDHAVKKRVQLSHDYVLAHPVGFPTPPEMTGAAYASLYSPKTLLSGTQHDLLKAEADALIAAGQATAV